MDRQNHIRLFERIAPVYGLFFRRQVGVYRRAVNQHGSALFCPGETVLDIGCGTGALAFVLAEQGLQVTGIDGSDRMIRLSRRFNKTNNNRFICGDILHEPVQQQLRQHDLVVASYVLHGLDPATRSVLYSFMKTTARRLVIIMDYNQTEGSLTSLIERLEGGDYFNFIQKIQQEMRSHFSEVKTIQTGKRAAWYLCLCQESNDGNA
ncbi:MAG: class I SAM-dependent methyltransferase [Ruminococcaceae bacterium]|nr:class I SAM-dependent methyltransferase [Oscillospiraceae bacterium]